MAGQREADTKRSQHNLAVALNLAASGFAIFPARSRDENEDGSPYVFHESEEVAKPPRAEKSPCEGVRWKQAATTSEFIIESWWRKWPNAVPALPLGPSGLVVIDCDKKPGKPDGVAGFDKLMRANGFDPDQTPVVATPSNGNHHYFRAPADQSMTNRTGNLPKGVDVRGANGYVIAPGAVMASGRKYQQFGALSQAPDMPHWLLDTIASAPDRDEPSKNMGRASAFVDPVRSNVTSERSDAEAWALLHYIDAGCGHDEWVEVLMALHAWTGGSASGLTMADEWSQSAPASYGGSKQVEAKWKSFRGSGIGAATLAALAERGGADLAAISLEFNPPEPVPAYVDATKNAFWEQFERVAEARWKDAEAQAADAVKIAHIAAERRAIEGIAGQEMDYDDAHTQWPGIVGELTDWICSTTRKPIRVHALAASLSIVGTLTGRKVYSHLRPCGTATYFAAIAPSGVGKQHAQDCIKVALNTVMLEGRGYCGWHASIQSIFADFTDCASRTMVVDEFAEKLASLRSKSAGSHVTAISQGLREFWGSTTGAVMPVKSLSSRSQGPIQRPNLSLFGACTIKDFTGNLVGQDVVNGLYNRFLVIPRYEAIDKQPQVYGMLSLPDDLKRKLLALHDCLDPMGMAQSVRGDGIPPNPIMVPFTAKAEAMDEANETYSEGLVRRSDDDAAALMMYARYAENIKRLAMISACGRSGGSVNSAVIDEGDMERAHRLVDWATSQAAMIIDRDMTEGIAQQNYQMVMSIIRKAGTITRRDLFARVKGKLMKRDIDAILDAMDEAGTIVSVRVPQPSGAGRPTVNLTYISG